MLPASGRATAPIQVDVVNAVIRPTRLWHAYQSAACNLPLAVGDGSESVKSVKPDP